MGAFSRKKDLASKVRYVPSTDASHAPNIRTFSQAHAPPEPIKVARKMWEELGVPAALERVIATQLNVGLKKYHKKDLCKEHLVEVNLNVEVGAWLYVSTRFSTRAKSNAICRGMRRGFRLNRSISDNLMHWLWPGRCVLITWAGVVQSHKERGLRYRLPALLDNS